jgi:hypothetical protein
MKTLPHPSHEWEGFREEKRREEKRREEQVGSVEKV